MHVHANYSQQLATLGVGRDDAQEIATRRAAEVRKRLATAGGLAMAEDEVAFVQSSSPIDPGPEHQPDGTSAEEREPQHPEMDMDAEGETGSRFSALA